MPAEIISELNDRGIPQTEHNNLEPVLASSDVIYVTRVQKERFEDLQEYEKVKGAYVITPRLWTAPRTIWS